MQAFEQVRELDAAAAAGCPHVARTMAGPMTRPAIRLASKKAADTLWSHPARPSSDAMPDTAVVAEVDAWMDKRLPCVAGRREYKRGRYMIRAASRETVPAIFEDFKQALSRGAAVACLYVFNAPCYAPERAGVAETFEFLARQMEPISKLPARDLANGAPLTNAVELECPVTGELTTYDDFECIAFCPQSNHSDDPLYDPLLAMPYPCVNMSSDVYAFSRFVADGVEKVLEKPAWQETDLDRLEEVLKSCVDRWQRFAAATIGKYESLTDTNLCPVHVTGDTQYWIAAHKDPAFAETIKEVHKHELPVLYGNRIVEGWMAHFRGGDSYSASGMARDGEPV